MAGFSASCLAISLADRSGTLTFDTRESRLGGTYVALADDRGTIEVADDMPAALERVEALRARGLVR